MLSMPLWPLIAYLFLLISSTLAEPCVGFDANSGLYLYGLTRDVSLGPSANWNANPLGMSDLTLTGRPPFDGPNTQCFFSQYQNAMYVLNADTTQPSNLHIFNFNSQTWSTQQIDASGTDPNSLVAILDRNTNVFFALSGSSLYELQMDGLREADGTTRAWQFVGNPSFAQDNAYPEPVMALAQNHIHFLNTGTPAQVEIFVIHFAYVQPEPQVFPPSEYGGSGFPSTHGYTASIFKDYENVQTKFAFIPDDGSATYIFDVLTNTTQQIQGPPVKDTVMIAASQSELVQMTKTGEVYWLPINQNDPEPNYAAQWSKIAHDIPLTALPVSNSTQNGGLNHTSTQAAITTADIPNAALRIEGGLVATLFMAALGLCGLWTSI